VARDVAEPLAEAVGSIPFATGGLRGSWAEVVLGHEYGPIADLLGSLKSDQDAELDKCGRFATCTWIDLFDTGFAGW